jgi:hypothetical protein
MTRQTYLSLLVRPRFSLRVFLLLVAIIPMAIGLYVERARRQFASAAELSRLDVSTHYAHEHDWINSSNYKTSYGPPPALAAPMQLRRLLGDDYLATITAVTVPSDCDVEAIVPHLLRLPGLVEVFVPGGYICGNAWPGIMKTKDELQSRLPSIRVRIKPSGPIIVG